MEKIRHPNQLGPALLAAINACDLERVMECYEQGATFELPNGRTVTGANVIRSFYTELLESRPQFEPGGQAPALIHGDVALTTTKIGGTASAEVARRQPDGTWRWVVDRPNVMLRNHPG